MTSRPRNPSRRRETWRAGLGAKRQVETRGRPGDQAVDAEPGRSGPKVQSLQEDGLSRRPRRNVANGRPMMRRRNRPSTGARAPAAPRESRRRIEQVPSGDDQHFSWKVGEAIYSPSIYGPAPRRLETILRDCWPVGKPRGGTK
jgi:hypothetical protein